VTTIALADRSYEVDLEGFLVDPATWDEAFAQHMAEAVGIRGPLTVEHWDVLRAIRGSYRATGRCPLVYQACCMTGLDVAGLKRLFPAGYLRGACRLAGLTFDEGYRATAVDRDSLPDATAALGDKVYRVDVRGFLIDPYDWDEEYAQHKAREIKMAGGLTERHWQVIRFLREAYERDQDAPDLHETCKAVHLDLDELQRLFPDGYHRGALKVAGLRVR
jgi:tRNA 2-thiouridine synthesizing protein E